MTSWYGASSSSFSLLRAQITLSDPINLTTTPKGDDALKIIEKGAAFVADLGSLMAHTPLASLPSRERRTGLDSNREFSLHEQKIISTQT
jgi:hypothetical protein